MSKLNSLEGMFREIESILKRLNKDDLVCVIHHDDADGSCSAALFSILIQELTQSFPLTFAVRGANGISRKLVNTLKTLNPEMVVVLDMSVDPKRLNLFSGFVLDHHIFEVDAKERNMQYFNPRFFEKEDEKIVPTSYMVYRLLKDLAPDRKVSWIAAIGITEDHRVDTCRGVFEDVKVEHPDVLKAGIISQETIEKTVFVQMWDMIRSGRMVKGSEGSKTATLALIETKHRPDQFINGISENSFKLKKYYERMLHATQMLMKDLETKGKFYRDKKVIVYEPKNVGLSGVTSYISDKIRSEYPEWVVCVVNRNVRGGKAKVSIRVEQQKRDVDLVKILKVVEPKIESMSGGGHKSAVGLTIAYKDFKRFLEEFLARI